MHVYVGATLASIVFAYIWVKCCSYKKELVLPNGRKYEISISKVLIAFVSILPLFLVAAVRYQVGTDYNGYIQIFEQISRGERTHVEFGYYYLNKLVLFFTNNPMYVFVLSAFITNIFIFGAIYELSVDAPLSIFLYVFTINYFCSLNIVRQYMALAIFLYSLKYVQQRKFLKYILMVFLASMFHVSLLIAIRIYFFSRFKPDLWKVIFTIILAIIFQPFCNVALHYFLGNTYYKLYLTDQYVNSFSLIYAAINFGILTIALWYYRYQRNERLYTALLNIQIVSVLVTIYSGIIPLAYRILWSLSIINILFIPMILKREKSVRLRRFLYTLIIIVFFCFTTIVICQKGYNDVLPYKTIWT